ncbi:hypothetical protein pb186bvf_001120 [Paramecium bursaria]
MQNHREKLPQFVIRNRIKTVQEINTPEQHKSLSPLKSQQKIMTRQSSQYKRSPPKVKRFYEIEDNNYLTISKNNHRTICQELNEFIQRQPSFFNTINASSIDNLSLYLNFDGFDSFLEFCDQQNRDQMRQAFLFEFLAIIIVQLTKANILNQNNQSDIAKYMNIALDNHYVWVSTIHNLLLRSQLRSMAIEDYLQRFPRNICNNTLSQTTTLIAYVSEGLIQNNLVESELKRSIQDYIQLINSNKKVHLCMSVIKSKILPKVKQQTQSFSQLIPFSDSYTLVLDLDETLIHFDMNSNKLNVRPYLQHFLKQMSSIFELVIFTSGIEQYANPLINQIDPLKYVKYRLYRQHTDFNEGKCIKDLRKLCRPLHKVIMIDNITSNFSFQPHNGILVTSWFNDLNDKELLYLVKILKTIRLKYQDVRIGLRLQEDIEGIKFPR